MMQLFPSIILGLSLGASLIYFYNGDIAHGLYWFFGAGITFTATFLM